VTSLGESVRDEWRRFASDLPGHRFVRRHQRIQDKNSGRAAIAARLVLGVLLVAGGVFLWFFPGPGWLLVFFGLAMFAGYWQGLARFLDKLEVSLRRLLASGRRFWARAPVLTKALVVVVASAMVAALGYGAWILFFGG
jgi:hypothetical protein